MTAQIADDIMKYLAPQGVMVMLEAEHMCMTMRGDTKARQSDRYHGDKGSLCGE